MKILTEAIAGVTVLRIVGKLTLGEGDVLLREVFTEKLRAGERRFLLDLTEVAYLDSAGVGEIVVCAKRAADAAAVVKVEMSARGKAREVFVVTSLDQVFEIFTDEDAAIASFAS